MTDDHMVFWNREQNRWCCEEHGKYRVQAETPLSTSAPNKSGDSPSSGGTDSND